MEELTPRPLPLEAWLALMAREYFAGFLPEGGGALKVALAADALVPAAIAGLAARAQAQGLRAIAIDAAETRLHMPQDLFFALARRLDWMAMTGAFLERLFASHQHPWPAPGERLDRAVLAERLDLAPPVLDHEIAHWLSRGIWADRRLARDFRSAMLRLAEARLDPDEAAAAPVLAWLSGEKPPAGELRRAGIGGRITRQTARAMLISLCHWLRLCGNEGLVVTLDVRRLHQTGVAATDGVRYSPAAVMDAFEVLRELIDDAEHLPGLFVVVLAGDALVGGEPRRALAQYPALQMRVWPDVRPGAGQNPLAPMVRLGA